jgi:actin-related protein
MDIGSASLKAGFAGDDAPKCYVPMIVGQPKDPAAMVGMEFKDYYFGHEAISKREKLHITEPVQNGIIQDIGLIEKIMSDQIFNTELRVSPDEHKMIVSEPPLNPKKNREELVTLMFEEFKVPKLYIANQAVMSLFATGKTTGTVLDIGEGITHAVPIYEGYAIPHAIQTVPLCGRDITNFLHNLLQNSQPDLITDSFDDFEEVKKIKEKMCFMALDFDAELK